MEFSNFWHLLEKYMIVIPIIQRDYAQGRLDYRSSMIRKSFVAALIRAVLNPSQERPLSLGFIYGIARKGQFLPFDGQQRLCTLFLFYLSIAVREGRLEEALPLLKRFRHEVREETRVFIENLLDYLSLHAGGELKKLFLASGSSSLIASFMESQPWFSPSWHRDPSISGFMVTLDEIRLQIAGKTSLWSRLVDQAHPPIAFYFTEISEFDANADDLFIKMNVRGRPLGPYEKFKAIFLEWLKCGNPEKEELIAHKLDMDWLDLFWSAFGKKYGGDKARHSESCFYNFLLWLGDILGCLSENKGGLRRRRTELSELLIPVLEAEQKSLAQDNLLFMEEALDSLALLEREAGVSSCLKAVFLEAGDGSMPEQGKISWFHEVDMFREICLKSQVDPAISLMFFAFLLMLIHTVRNREKPHARAYPFPDERQRRILRVIRNLLDNSPSELGSQNQSRQLKALIKLIEDGVLEQGKAFDNMQLAEELAKMDFRQANHPAEEALDWLEDHPLLRGCVAVFSKRSSRRNRLKFSGKTLEAGKRFFAKTLADKPLAWDQLLRGFLSQNIFGLREGSWSNKYLYLSRDGSDGRRRIFTASRADCFGEIRDSVQKLAERIGQSDAFTMESVVGKIAYRWLEKRKKEKRLDWRWYFVAYPEILPGYCQTDGYYDWDRSWKSFEQRQLQKQILKGPHKNPFLWAVYVESGFTDPDINKGRVKFVEESGRGNDNPIAFPRCGLGLWGGELYWRIHTINGLEPGGKQLAYMEILRKRLAEKGIMASKGGYCLIPGQDSRKYDRASFSAGDVEDIIREYDFEDRILLGKAIALEMRALG